MEPTPTKPAAPAHGENPDRERAGELLSRLVLTADEAAAVLAVSADTIKNLHRVGALPGIKVGRHRRWRVSDVRAFVEGLESGVS